MKTLIVLAIFLQLLLPSIASRAQESPANALAATVTRPAAAVPTPVRLPGRIGIALQSGINGIGGETAVAVVPHFNVRLGGQYFGYSTTFQQDGANVSATLRLGGGKASLDWFPFHNGFHLSPLLVFANLTDARAKVIVPPGARITLSGTDYRSSQTDPLHGSGSVGFSKVAPGLTVGYGNILGRRRKHFSFPVELGFYHVGQPALKVAFSGSACDPSLPEPIGCQSVLQDPGFQKDLAAFIRRNNHNLSYASNFPIFSFGFGYSF